MPNNLTFATDELAGVHLPHAKLAFGSDGNAVMLADAGRAMIGLIGYVGRPGLLGAARRQAVGTADFAQSAVTVTATWGTVAIGDLIPSNAPAGITFQLVNEPAGLAVVNG
jgi:hypothetical protein